MNVTRSEFVRTETTALVDDLTKYADRPVTIQLRGGFNLQTDFGPSSPKAICLVMDPRILRSARSEEKAREIWRALGFYQLQQQLHPATVQLGKATEAGYRLLFVLVNDENLERMATAADANVGSLLQTLAGYVYRGNTRARTDAVTAIVTDAVGGGYEANATYVQRVNEFAYYFRRHLTAVAETDALVVEALGFVPAELKDMSKDQLLELAGQIHAVLSRGITLPKPVVAAAIKAIEPDADATTDEVVEETVEADDPLLSLSPVDPAWWQTVLRSRWSYVTLFTSVFVWLVLCLSVGMDIWLGLFWTIVASVAVGMVAGGISLWVKRRREAEGEDEDSPPDRGFSLKALWKALFGWIRIDVGINCTRSGLGALIGGGSCAILGLAFAGSFGAILGGIVGAFGGAVIGGAWQQVCASAVECWNSFNIGVWRPLARCTGELWTGLQGVLADWRDRLSTCAFNFRRSPLVSHICSGAVNLARGIGTWVSRTAYLAWRSPSFRLFVIALPIAMLLSMLYAVAAFGAQMAIWQLIIIVVVWVAVLSFSWIFRHQIKQFLTADVFTDEEVDHDVSCRLPVDKQTLTFEPIGTVVAVDANPAYLLRTQAEVATAAGILSSSLRRAGFVNAEKDDRADGHDLIEDLEVTLFGETDVFIGDVSKRRTWVSIDVLVDCSDSQREPTATLRAGDKFERSKKLALAIEAAVKGKRGISARFWGFTDTEMLDCGLAGSGRLSGLQPGGGNNDAAALQVAAQSAAARGRSAKIVILISDVQPADCSWGALNQLGWRLTQEGVIVIQVAVDKTDDSPLPWNMVDLHDQNLQAAAAQLGSVFESQLVSA